MLKRIGLSALFFALLSIAVLPVHATSKTPNSVTYKDWELRCDNTRTCRAAGYQLDKGTAQPVSMLLTRLAGPDTALQISLQVSSDNSTAKSMRLAVGNVVFSNLTFDTATLVPEQVRSVLPELLKNSTATVTAGTANWTLSLNGINAVLLKMDEMQGRLDTPGALIRRGNRAESSVYLLLPEPLVRNVRPAPARGTDAALGKLAFPALDLRQAKEQCNNKDAINAKALEVRRLTETQLLLSLPCSMGAYNASTMHWIAIDKPPYTSRLISAEGDFDAAAGSIMSSMKGRGVGDCWSLQTWHFIGNDFALTQVSGDSMCRGCPGGAWSLTSHTAKLAVPPPPPPPPPLSPPTSK